MSNTNLVILAVVIVAILLAALWVFSQRQKTRKLRSKFGPEYDRVVAEHHGNAQRAEAVLGERQRRVSKLQLRTIGARERELFETEWKRVQESFVDDPKAAVAAADRLVNEALLARGYPMSDFDQRAADISVEHPYVADNYRAAHDIAVQAGRGQATTEHLRKAMQHYRNLFEDVLQNEVADHTRNKVGEEIHR